MWSELTSQQHVRVSQGQTCPDSCTCCHTGTEVADQTRYLSQSRSTDTRPTSLSAVPNTPDACVTTGVPIFSFESVCMTRPGKDSRRKRDSNPGLPHLKRIPFRTRPTKRSKLCKYILRKSCFFLCSVYRDPPQRPPPPPPIIFFLFRLFVCLFVCFCCSFVLVVFVFCFCFGVFFVGFVLLLFLLLFFVMGWGKRGCLFWFYFVDATNALLYLDFCLLIRLFGLPSFFCFFFVKFFFVLLSCILFVESDL